MQSFGQVSAITNQGVTGKGFMSTTQSGSVRFREPESNFIGSSSTSEATESKPRSLSVPDKRVTNNLTASNSGSTKDETTKNLERENKELRDRLETLEKELYVIFCLFKALKKHLR